jgi:hypothetical protein
MGRSVEFNASNWQQILFFSATAGRVGENSRVPIPPRDSFTLIESDIIAVHVSTTVPTGRRWRWGGTVEQRFRTGLTVGGTTDAAGEPKNMYIGAITTIFFPRITAQYSLRFHIPRWFDNVQVTAWQYTGPDDDLTDITLAQEFSNINFKLDQLLG